MNAAPAYLHVKNFRWNFISHGRAAIVMLVFILISGQRAFSQADDAYDEISITLNVQRIGSLEIPAIIHGEVAYLPVKELFDFLKIKNSSSPDLDSLSGFFINPKSIFVFNKAKNQIVYLDKIFDLQPTDLIRTETNLYLKSDYFGQVFGLECTFSFRSLSILLTTKLELPAIREMQQELMRRNISKLKGEKKADTTIGRRFPLFQFGMADWSVINSQEINGINTSRINVGLGAMLAGGEANLSLFHNSGQPFTEKQQFYSWRFVNNNNPVLRQITAGKIFAQSTASLYAPIKGIQFTNTPTTYRRSFGTYTLSNTTQPGWLVELYVNNVLVNYTKADASGFFSFPVPIVYGNSIVKLRFYGPWGEERIREESITIPFNFLPRNQFEYNITAGIVDDDKKSHYSRANFNYGLGNHITVGGGIEYLSSVTSGKTMPFMKASVRLGSKFLVSGEHTYGVRSKAIVSYRLPSNLQMDLNYLRYDRDQTAISFIYNEERKAVLSMPIRGKHFTAFSRLTVNQFIFAKQKSTGAEFLLSGIVKGISTNLTTNTLFPYDGDPIVYSNLSLTYRLPGGVRFTPQAQYEYGNKKFSMIRGEVEKIIFHQGFLNLSYQKNILFNNSSIGLGLRYNFSFAQTSFSARQSNHLTILSQSARGSFLYDGRTNYLGTNNQNNVGKGGIIISPFLDLNCNGLRESNEPKAFGLKLHINGGRIQHNQRDTTIRIIDLDAYTDYFIELEKNSFDNIAWQMHHQTIRVAIDPNHFKFIEVPVAVVGEASGTIYLNGKEALNGLGRIIVNFYNSDSALVAKTLTESDGYFSYMGLAPGTYTASIDPGQLLKLNMTSSSAGLTFSIKSSKDGDIVDGLQFVLNANGEGPK